MSDQTSEPQSQFLIYRSENGTVKIDVRFENETVRLSQHLMAELFETTQQKISLHLQNIFDEGELGFEATHKEYLLVDQRSQNIQTCLRNSRATESTVRHHFGMALIPPKVRQLVRPSPEDQAARSQEWEIEREQREQRRIDERPRRRAAIELGPPLRDIDAAVDCHCGCHPRPAELETHDGGVSCNCQLTPAEREAIWKEFEDFEPDSELVDEQRMRTEDFEREATRLVVHATVRVEAFPFVIGGVVDGRAFYMRERNGSYRITIAHDDNPLNDPWSSDVEVPTIDIAVGSEAEFKDETGTPSQIIALQITVQSIRTYLLRRNCPHEPTNDTDFCRRCGIQLPT